MRHAGRARRRRWAGGCLALFALLCLIGSAAPHTAGANGAPALDEFHRARILERAAGLPRLRSLLVSVGGERIEEHYFNGAAAHRSANLKSASKTIIAILVGIAIDRGYVAGVDQPIVDFFPDELADAEPAKRSITVGDLLSMRSGLETTSNRNYGRWVRSRHWVRHALSRPLVDRPGGRMIYSTGSTHLLSAILTRATGMSTLEFGRRYLARLLGITLPAWTRDPQGVYLGGNEMGLTPRAMLAVGDLFRRGGTGDGRQVISREWIRASTVPRTRSRFSGRQYGYGWWMRTLAGHPTYYAWGYGGQFIFVIPDLDAVIVATSSPNPGSGRRRHRRELDDLIGCDLVPAIRRAVAEAAR
ncbi:MAG: serine hydrolase [Acidobacteriota bacterium]|nr:serine hydrolase [Acidobacteriota bacterium]